MRSIWLVESDAGALTDSAKASLTGSQLKSCLKAEIAIDKVQMNVEKDLENDDQIAQIRNDTYMPDSQKQALIKAIRKSHDQQRQQMIDPTKPDWPAVKSYRDELEQLTDWYAGNIPNPPQVD